MRGRVGPTPQAVFLIMAVAAAACVAPAPALAQDPGHEAPAADTAGTSAVEAPADSAAAGQEPASEPNDAAPADEPPAREASGSEFSVLRAYICRGIEQSEPTEAGKSFIPTPEGILHLWCFSEIGGPARSDTILHVWYWGDREMARVPLEVKGPRWRTWSTKRIPDEWSGEWHVDIADRSGAVLSRLHFSVEPERE